MEHEAERLEVLGGGLDGQREGQALRRPSRPEWLQLLAPGPGMDPRALLAEAGDQGRPGELGDRPDPAQAEADQPGPNIRILSEQARRQRGEEGGLAAGATTIGAAGRAWTAAIVAVKRVPAIPARIASSAAPAELAAPSPPASARPSAATSRPIEDRLRSP